MEIDVVAADKDQDILTTDNLPSPEVLSKYRSAGHFCSLAIKSVIARCVPGANCTELCQLGDETIIAQARLI
jgi:methionine aminopeptidase